MKPKGKTSQISKMLSDKELIVLAQSKEGVKKAVIISPKKVETAPWVRLKCQFGCGGYGQCLVCPPFTPTPEQMRQVLDSYCRGLLIHFSPNTDVKSVIVELEREIFLRGAWKAFGLGAGPCSLCKKCSLKMGDCRNSELARPAMEACGIDVFSTVLKAGFKIKVIKTMEECPNYFGLVLVD
jgi:predicted metal-binding protein